jgi:predicted DsbA family dithiol-disulfide isomerase
VEAFGRDRVEIDWKPFVIDPGTKLEGESVEAYCQRRWGGSGWTHHLKTEGRKDGARFDNWKVWPNTWKAHQLIQYCRDQAGMSTDTVNQVLFRAEYEEGRNISQVETLVELAQRELGMDADNQVKALQTYLTMDQGKSQVESEIRSGRSKYGIRGVPYFVVRGNDDPSKQRRPYGFSGAQSAESLMEIFQEMAGDDEDEEKKKSVCGPRICTYILPWRQVVGGFRGGDLFLCSTNY